MSALAWLRDWWPRLVAGLALAVVAVVTGRISYTHIKALSLALHQPPGDAAIMAFGVDGLVIVGAVVLLQAAPGQEWLGWLGVGPGVAASLFANWESGIPYGIKAAVWATVPAVSFALACFLFERWLYAQVGRVAQAGPAGPPEPETETPSAVPAPADGAQSEPPTKEAALLALIGTGSRRDVAELLGVPKTRVDRWHARLSQPDGGGPEAVRDGPDDDAEAGGVAAERVAKWAANGASHDA